MLCWVSYKVVIQNQQFLLGILSYLERTWIHSVPFHILVIIQWNFASSDKAKSQQLLTSCSKCLTCERSRRRDDNLLICVLNVRKWEHREIQEPAHGHAPNESLDQCSHTGRPAPEPVLLTIMKSCSPTTDEDETHEHVQTRRERQGSSSLVNPTPEFPNADQGQSHTQNSSGHQRKQSCSSLETPLHCALLTSPASKYHTFHEMKMQADNRNFPVVLKYPSTIKCWPLCISPSLEKKCTGA